MTQEKQSQNKVDYTIKSNKKCIVCGMPLKQNVVTRNPHAVHCYVCFKVQKGILKVQRNRVKNGELVLIKEVDFLELQRENIRKYKNR
jgi:hypothetical protein